MSLLIKGAEIVNYGEPLRRADVLVVGTRIAAIGDLASYKADKSIDASGCYLSSGFILPVSSDKRLTLFSDPRQGELLLEGVTTAVFGASGVSLAPTNYGELDTLNPWSSGKKLNTDWRGFGELIKTLGSLRLGVNFAGLSGYETIRRSIANRRREFSKNEIMVASHIVSQSLAEGSFGISLILEKDSPISEQELSAIIKAADGAPFWISRRFLKEKVSDLLERFSITEAPSSIIVHDAAPMSGEEKDWRQTIDSAKNLASSSAVYFSASPFTEREISFADFFGDIVLEGSAASLKDALLKPRVQATVSKLLKRFPPETILISDAPETHRFLVGKSLSEFALNRLISPEEALVRIFDITRGNAAFFARFSAEEAVKEAILHPRSFIQGGWSPMADISAIHKKLSKPVSRFLEIAGGANGLPIADALGKLSTIPAKVLDLEKRGGVKEGNIADLVIVSDNKVRDVVVSGALSVSGGVLTEDRGGKILTNDF